MTGTSAKASANDARLSTEIIRYLSSQPIDLLFRASLPEIAVGCEITVGKDSPVGVERERLAHHSKKWQQLMAFVARQQALQISQSTITELPHQIRFPYGVPHDRLHVTMLKD